MLAVRLRTLLAPEAGVSPELVSALAALLDTGLHPGIPATGNGAAGEIIPLAHLGAFLTGQDTGPTGDSLAGTAYTFAAKEGVAFLQGVPVATARAVLVAADVRLLVAQQVAVTAAEVALTRAPRDPYHPALARGDAELGTVLAGLRSLAGDEPDPRMLQAPVSFRVAGPALAHLLRAATRLDEAVERALTGVTTSPALVDGTFLGTAGFDGFDLAASLDAVRLALLHAAETGAARLHRMLDPRVTGLPPQLSPEPGRQTGLVAVHKRAVGLLHEARRGFRARVARRRGDLAGPGGRAELRARGGPRGRRRGRRAPRRDRVGAARRAPGDAARRHRAAGHRTAADGVAQGF